MRAVMVVVVTPCRDQVAGMAQAREQVLVEALVSQATNELLPWQDRIRGQFRAVVTDHHAGIAP